REDCVRCEDAAGRWAESHDYGLSRSEGHCERATGDDAEWRRDGGAAGEFSATRVFDDDGSVGGASLLDDAEIQRRWCHREAGRNRDPSDLDGTDPRPPGVGI